MNNEKDIEFINAIIDVGFNQNLAKDSSIELCNQNVMANTISHIIYNCKKECLEKIFSNLLKELKIDETGYLIVRCKKIEVFKIRDIFFHEK